MTRFRFRLERVLHARRAAEQMQRAELAAAENLARRAEERADAWSDDVRTAQTDVRAAQAAKSLDAGWILVSHTAHEQMVVVERDLCAAADVASDAAATERAAWRALRADVRGLERLEARGRERMREKIATEEERAIEEFAARQAEQRRRMGERR